MKKLLVLSLLLGFLAGCSSQTNTPSSTEKPKPKPPEAISGRSAFQKLYLAARGWARDAQGYRLQSDVTGDFQGRDGKAAVWRGYFASASERATKPYSWSSGDIEPGTLDSYSPTNSSTQVFDIAYLKVDTDKAFEIAQKHGGDKLLEKSPNTPVFYILEWSRPTSELVWHVLYGSAREDAKLRVAINASTGDFIRVEK
jgi:hypothetical protein